MRRFLKPLVLRNNLVDRRETVLFIWPPNFARGPG
jgi:hypothetical protein